MEEVEHRFIYYRLSWLTEGSDREQVGHIVSPSMIIDPAASFGTTCALTKHLRDKSSKDLNIFLEFPLDLRPFIR